MHVYILDEVSQLPNENSSSSNNNEDKYIALYITIVICAMIIIVAGMILTFFKYRNDKYHYNKQNESLHSYSYNNSNNNNNIPKQPISATSPTSVATTIIELGNKNNINNNDIFADLKKLNNKIANANVGNNSIEIQNEGNPNINETNIINNKQNELIDENDDEIYDNDNIKTVGNTETGINNKDISKWNERDVIIWLKKNLLNNGFNKQIILSFLEEFQAKYITGKLLLQLKNQPNLIDELKKEFSQQNQAFGIWMVIRTEIQSLDQNKYLE